MNKAYRFRIYPTKAQAEFINRTVGCCRKVYNELLVYCENQYKETGKNKVPNYNVISCKYDYMKEVDSMALNYSALNLKTAYKNFFNSIKGNRLKNVDHPKKKRWRDSGSYTTTRGTKADNSKYIRGGKLFLPKIKEGIKIVMHREIEGNIKHVTVTREPSQQYYVSICVELPDVVPSALPVNPNVVGIDMSLNELAVYSDGTSAKMPKYFKDMEKKLARAQKKMARKQKDSNNYIKQKHKVAKIHQRIADARKDFLNKESARIVKEYDVVVVEDIDLIAMGSNKSRHSRSVMDNGFGIYRNMIDYKIKDKGGLLVKADKKYPSSQLCSKCGYKNPKIKNYWIKTWTCPECGSVHDRDYNAAINLRNYCTSRAEA